MNLSQEDHQLLEELCQQHDINFQKVVRLWNTVKEYEFMDRRAGVYDDLRDILQTKHFPPLHNER